MVRNRRPKAPSAGAPAADPPEPALEEPPASLLASQLGRLAFGDECHSQPQPPGPRIENPKSDGTKGGKAAVTGGGGGAGPSSAASSPATVPSSSIHVAAPGDPPQEPPLPPAEKACACCLVVIAGKVFFCSRCHLVTYCGKDCQASVVAFDIVEGVLLLTPWAVS